MLTGHILTGKLISSHLNYESMRTQKKENYYYVFWTVAMIAFIVPQVFTAYAYMNIKALLEKPFEIEIVEPSKIKLGI